MNKSIFLFLLASLPVGLWAQGTLTGDLQTNVNFFMKDAKIGASGNPLYDNDLTGSETWASVRYSNNGWTFNLRADVFNNSNLYNPSQALTASGIGAYSVSKEFNDLTVTFGYIYDQIGSGILFRSYEDRGLLIDNAIYGLGLKYKIADNIFVKGFSGQQKNLFDKYAPVIRGINAEGSFGKGKAHFIPGFGVVNRTLDPASMNVIAATINSQDLSTRFLPRWNMYAFTAYNTFTYKSFSWYLEGAYKTHEAILNANNLMVDKPGNVEYTTLSYGRKGLAINLASKRTENFVMRTSPNDILVNSGQLNWEPVVAVIRPERLMSRYTPASQDLSEMATTVSALYNPSDALNFVGSFTDIDQLNGNKLYREGYLEGNYTGAKKWLVQGGIQYMEYNQQVYQVSFPPNQPMIYALTPFTEITYRLTDSKSLRFEAQYMDTKQDFGSWVFVLLEYNLAPKFSISASDMYNITPNYNNDQVTAANHYPSVYTAFTKGPHRLSLAYVKQVAGINCTGGVCRYEPAFSGVRTTLTTSF